MTEEEYIKKRNALLKQHKYTEVEELDDEYNN